MQIKKDKPTFFLINLFKGNFKKLLTRRSVVVILIIVFLMLYGLGSIYYGMKLYKNRTAETLNDFIHDVLAVKLGIFKNIIEGQLSQPEVVYIDIKFKNLQKILGLRKLVLKYRHFGSSAIGNKIKNIDIPVKFTHNNMQCKAKIQLTGWNNDHIVHDKWSFRVKLKGDNTFMGMKEFSFLYPATRGNLSEWVVHELEKKEGLIALRFDFVNVYINGKDMGIYVLEEHFEKRLVENRGYHEGLLFKGSYERLKIYNKKKVQKNKYLYSQVAPLQSRWRAFLIGDIPAGSLFDLKKMARYYAISDLVQGHHTHIMMNEKFYLNPITNLIEPIGREYSSIRYSDAGRKFKFSLFIKEYINDNPNIFNKRLFKSLTFVKEYLSTLDKMSKTKFLDDFFASIKGKMKEKLSFIHKDNPAYGYPSERLYQYQKLIREELNSSSKNYLAAYLEKNGTDSVKFTVRNLSYFPLEIKSVLYNDLEIKKFKTEEIVLRSINGNKTEQVHTFMVKMDKKILKEPFDFDSFKINFNILGIEKIKTINVFPYPIRLSSTPEVPRNFSSLKKITFLDFSKEKNQYSFNCKEINIKENLIIPKGFKIVIPAGTIVDLTNGAKFITYSSLFCKGEKDKPILITSSDNSGEGLTIFSTKNTNFKYVTFSNLSAPESNGWSLSGSVNTYESTVSFDSCTFENNLRGDDMINLVRSNFKISNCKFIGTKSDALDSDFSHGRVFNTTFRAIGNDAIDLSGTNLAIDKILIDITGDKGISAGEKSHIDGKNITILNSEIAVSSKDLSSVNLNNLKIENSPIGFAIYEKKPEYGPGSAVINNLTLSKVKKLKLLEYNSKLIIDGKIQTPDSKNVKKMLYGAIYGKSSK